MSCATSSAFPGCFVLTWIRWVVPLMLSLPFVGANTVAVGAYHFALGYLCFKPSKRHKGVADVERFGSPYVVEVHRARGKPNAAVGTRNVFGRVDERALSSTMARMVGLTGRTVVRTARIFAGALGMPAPIPELDFSSSQRHSLGPWRVPTYRRCFRRRQVVSRS